MANLLKMAIVQSILSLHAQGFSARRIARTLGVNRETVSRYIRSSLGSGPKPANAPISPAGSDGGLEFGTAAAGATALARPSQCAPWRDFILAKLGQGLSLKRIHQDLVAQSNAEHVSYDSLRRFVRRLGVSKPAPYRRMECAPGEEAQVDFGTGAPVLTPEGKRQRTYVFRIVLSHSRKAYSEACYRQTTEEFIRVLENALWCLGGVTKTLVIDNLRAAVSKPDWFDPELNPKLMSFCHHYGTVILPTKPYMPRHKGKVERGIGYVKNNALKGHTFESLAAQNQHLADWERTIADTRIHGTTKQQVSKLFVEVERAALLPLPAERFPFFHEARRTVSRDGHIEVAKAYYSVPPEYLSRQVWARWDGRMVRVFNHRWEQIAIHVRQDPGRYSTLGVHLRPEKVNGIERGATWLLGKAKVIGPDVERWSEAMLQTRGIEGIRVLQGLLALSKRYPSDTLNESCQTALSYGAFRLRTLRELLKRKGAIQQPLSFLDEHPIIRPLADYGQWVQSALLASGGRNQQDPQVPSPEPPSSFPSSLFP